MLARRKFKEFRAEERATEEQQERLRAALLAEGSEGARVFAASLQSVAARADADDAARAARWKCAWDEVLRVKEAVVQEPILVPRKEVEEGLSRSTAALTAALLTAAAHEGDEARAAALARAREGEVWSERKWAKYPGRTGHKFDKSRGLLAETQSGAAAVVGRGQRHQCKVPAWREEGGRGSAPAAVGRDGPAAG